MSFDHVSQNEILRLIDCMENDSREYAGRESPGKTFNIMKSRELPCKWKAIILDAMYLAGPFFAGILRGGTVQKH